MIPYDRHRWFAPLLASRGSIGRVVALRVFAFVALSALIAYGHKRGVVHAIYPAIHAMFGTVLGLLMTFRTQTGYDRFWEGRRAWGSIVNRSRDLGRHLVSAIPMKHRRECILHVCLFVHSLRAHLWGTSLDEEVKRLFPSDKSLLEVPGPVHRSVLALSQRLRGLAKEGTLDAMTRDRIERSITELVDQWGVCQRIKRTPIPFAYVIHIRRCLVLFLATLPFAIVDSMGMWTPLTIGLLAYSLLGIEEIGTEIEDPFDQTPNDLDLQPFTEMIEAELLALLGDEVDD
ncbi:MAG: bestrophin family protein, partial [Polyangiaceae bacterium]|nr:bestrophin family protein [Polyangiaceae bacterium]